MPDSQKDASSKSQANRKHGANIMQKEETSLESTHPFCMELIQERFRIEQIDMGDWELFEIPCYREIDDPDADVVWEEWVFAFTPKKNPTQHENMLTFLIRRDTLLLISYCIPGYIIFEDSTLVCEDWTNTIQKAIKWTSIPQLL